ncbi:hypothetical protein NC653_001692 [Populus alba x Populus x berolinensis]|uniref:Uncharacterized protein n=1 Tax=Populus alba x Populus x berolinensis TaxID=444605 RepID=A0AAD6RLQ4_9ROSI|nr:hypothetical protein NC653_001692 [Populus alba x Populus x berolinensis]
MQRSSKSSRVTEELFKNAITDTDQQELPTYDPLSHMERRKSLVSDLLINPGVYTNFPVNLLPIFILCSDLGFQKPDFSMLRRAKDLRIDNVGNGVNSWNRLLAGFPHGQKKKRSEGHSKQSSKELGLEPGAGDNYGGRWYQGRLLSSKSTGLLAYGHDDSYQD